MAGFYAAVDTHGLTAWWAIGFALERNLELPYWVRSYLRQSAAGIEDWAAQNEHTYQLKNILQLTGQRIHASAIIDPRWVYGAICQLRERKPSASITALVDELMNLHPDITSKDEGENVRQKYYQGKKLAETGKDYKGRDRKSDEPFVALNDCNQNVQCDDDLEF